MQRTAFIPFAAFLVAVLGGCELPEWGGSLPEPRPLGAGLATFRPDPTAGCGPGDSPAGAGEPKPTDGPLTLRDALALALLRSPELAAHAWAVREAEAERLGASATPNPELEAEAENFGGTGEFRGTRALETTITLSQLIESGGKRAKRMNLAAQDGALAGWDYEAKRLEVLTATTQRFVEVLALQEKLALAREDLKLAEATLDVVDKRLAAGKGAPTERPKASIELASSRVRLQRIERELAAAGHRLAATWGAASPHFDGVRGDLETLPEPPPPASLRAQLARSPGIARWATEIGRRRAALEVEQAAAVPDLTVGVGYRHARETEDNDRALLVTVGVPLPVFDRNQGPIAKARFGVLKARAEQAAAEVRIGAELEEACQALAAAHAEAVALRDEVLPAARSSFEAADRSFRNGKAEYRDVLDAQRTLIEAREEYVEAMASCHHAAAVLAGLIGGPLEAESEHGSQTKENTHDTQE